jgi:hypothetical protein
MPTITASAPTITKISDISYGFVLNGAISTMEKASDTYYGFNWGLDPSNLNHNVAIGTAIIAGAHTVGIAFQPAAQTVYYQFYITNGAVTVSSATQSGSGAATGLSSLAILYLLFIPMLGFVACMLLLSNGESGIKSIFIIVMIIVITLALLAVAKGLGVV